MPVHQIKFVNRVRTSTEMLARLKEAKAVNNALSAAISIYLLIFREAVIGLSPTKHVLTIDIDLTHFGLQVLVFKFKVINGAAFILDIMAKDTGPDGPTGYRSPAGSGALIPFENGFAEGNRAEFNSANEIEHRVAASGTAMKTRCDVPFLELLMEIQRAIASSTDGCVIDEDEQGSCEKTKGTFDSDYVVAVLASLAYSADTSTENSRSLPAGKASSLHALGITLASIAVATTTVVEEALMNLSLAEYLYTDGAKDSSAVAQRLRAFTFAERHAKSLILDRQQRVSLRSLLRVYQLVHARLHEDVAIRGHHGAGGLCEEIASYGSLFKESGSLVQDHPRLELCNQLFVRSVAEITRPQAVQDMEAVRNNLTNLALLLAIPFHSDASVIRNIEGSNVVTSRLMEARAEGITNHLSSVLLPDLVKLGSLELFREYADNLQPFGLALAGLLADDKTLPS